MTTINIKDITRIAMFTALIVVIGQISIPMPYGVPMTLQTFIIPFAGILLGRRDGLLSVFVYILLGMTGLPVFAGFSGGFGVVIGPTGGFILSFPLMAWCAALGAEKQTKLSLYLGLTAGATLNFLAGMLYFSFATSSTLPAAFAACVLPFLPTAVLKIVLIGLISSKMSRYKLYHKITG
ncbi:biotin transporter BioY [Vagococcus acidifermentans]|uniref:Biotin transporter n=1 Tax=Vagococcus acidifermentans TaxID=564710 RepID=A0A430AXN8_9ENTE|nr:biotin transporter BioY [Vagococcus acidifermentans]RSU12832.1 hypothetical protein CBF27_04655 [Vagococcus acidifermentans]